VTIRSARPANAFNARRASPLMMRYSLFIVAWRVAEHVDQS
jgi:hypothetical protein